MNERLGIAGSGATQMLLVHQVAYLVGIVNVGGFVASLISLLQRYCSPANTMITTVVTTTAMVPEGTTTRNSDATRA